MTDYMCVGLSAIYVCTQSCSVRDGMRVRQGKKLPTLSLPPCPPTLPHTSRLFLSKLDFILQEQSGMNKSFSSPLLVLPFLFFIPPPYFSDSLFFVFLHVAFSLFYFCHSFFLLPLLGFSFYLLKSLLVFSKDCIFVTNIKKKSQLFDFFFTFLNHFEDDA